MILIASGTSYHRYSPPFRDRLSGPAFGPAFGTGFRDRLLGPAIDAGFQDWRSGLAFETSFRDWRKTALLGVTHNRKKAYLGPEKRRELEEKHWGGMTVALYNVSSFVIKMPVLLCTLGF